LKRRPYVAGNWKMNLDRRSALSLAQAVERHARRLDGVDVAVVPPFVHLEAVARALADSPVRVGAQNMCDAQSGAFTGEISAAMLQEVGATFAVLGHSERRQLYGESDELVNAKVRAALAAGLDLILCVGETIEERRANQTEEVVRRQATRGLQGVRREDLARVTLAYEPVWAIGTGLTATPEQAGAVHQYLRGLLSGMYDDRTAQGVRIQYGGSVKPENAGELLRVPDIDGALVGGASLKPETFLPILDSAVR
jgi:triosephosphate isomerase